MLRLRLVTLPTGWAESDVRIAGNMQTDQDELNSPDVTCRRLHDFSTQSILAPLLNRNGQIDEELL